MDIETPWGRPDTIENVSDGLLIISTPSHGGILISPERLAFMPDYMHKPLYCGRFACYEEDCEWPMPILVFEMEFRAYYAKESTEKAQDILYSAKKILKDWHPDIYELYYRTKLGAGESHKRDEQIFYASNRNALLTVAAFGDWKDGVPEGMVGLCARLGGIMNRDTSKDRFFLVPAALYDKRPSQRPFVVDPALHQEIRRLD